MSIFSFFIRLINLFLSYVTFLYKIFIPFVVMIATDKSGNDCKAPSGYWKCLMKCTFSSPGEMSAAVGCAYLFDTNSSNIAPTVTTIDAIESRTGFDFLANVPTSLQTTAERQSYSFF